MPIYQIASKIVEQLLGGIASEGANKGAQLVYSNVGVKIGQKAVDFIAALAAGYIGEKTAEFLQEEFPELDEIPGMLGDKISDSQLAKIGRETMNRLSSEVRNKVPRWLH